MKKRILSLILMAAAAFGFQSCLFEQEDIFEESPSLRVAKTNELAQKVLTSAENGWLFEIYPEGTQAYGGYAFICKFNDDQTVDVYTELSSTPDKPETSYYKMIADNGPVLIFDTYNENMHFFSTPSSSAYQAYQGEFEFQICDVQDDLVKVRGTRTENTMYLRRMNKPAADYLAEIAAMDENILMSGFKGSIDGNAFEAEIDIDNRNIDFTVGEDVTTIAYTIIPEGFRLYKPFVINEKEMQAFAVADGAASVSVIDGAVAGTSFESIFPKGYRPYDAYAGKYIFKYDSGEFPVELVPAGDGVTYWMTGVTDYYDIALTYSKAKGNLSFTTQMLYDKTKDNELLMYNGKYFGLTAVSPSNATGTSGYLTYDFKHGMMTEWNEDEEHPVYKFVNNGLYSKPINTFWFCFYTGPTQTSSTRTSGSSAPTDYKPFGKSQIMFNIQSLSKVD